MSVRLVISPILVLFSCCLLGQQISRGGDDTGPPASSAANDGADYRQKILDRIVVLEAATRQAESANAGDLKLSQSAACASGRAHFFGSRSAEACYA